jgi:hypothetical protein
MAGAVLFEHLQFLALGGRLQPREAGGGMVPPQWQPIPLRSIDCHCGESVGEANFYRQSFTPPCSFSEIIRG